MQHHKGVSPIAVKICNFQKNSIHAWMSIVDRNFFFQAKILFVSMGFTGIKPIGNVVMKLIVQPIF